MMYCHTIYILLCMAVLSVCQKDDKIIRQDFDGPHLDGSYKWAIQTEGGIYHEQRGSLKEGRAAEPGLFVEGQYQYTAPNGEVINVLYTSGENGFVATGAHIPTPPPVPPVIQRAVDYLISLKANKTPKKGNGDKDY